MNDLGVVYTHINKNEEAAKLFEKALTIDPTLAEAYNNLGYVFTSQKKHLKALAAYREAVRLKPDWSIAVYNLGIGYLNCKNKNSALEAQKTLKSIDYALASKLLNNIHSDKILDVSQIKIKG
jgi:tetratricopeptide (TPR) repeat protein